MHNPMQLEGNQHINVPAGYGQPAAHRQWMGEEEPPRRRERPARSRWGEDRPELANLPLAQRRQIRLEEEAKAREVLPLPHCQAPMQFGNC